MRSLKWALAALTLAGAAHADVVTIGNSQFGTECSFTCGQRLQQIYDGDNFGSNPVTITSFNFFAGNDFNPTGAFDVYLGQSARAVGSPSSTYSTNIGANYVFVGTMNLSGPILGGAVVGLSGLSFDFDPSGDLLIDIINQNVSGLSSQQQPGQFISGFSSEISRTFSFFPGSSTTGNIDGNYGLLTRFNYVEAAQNGGTETPEPATLTLFAAGLIAASLARRRVARL